MDTYQSTFIRETYVRKASLLLELLCPHFSFQVEEKGTPAWRITRMLERIQTPCKAKGLTWQCCLHEWLQQALRNLLPLR